MPRLIRASPESQPLSIGISPIGLGQGTRTLDLAVVGEQGGRTRHCRSCQRQHDRARAQKNTLQPHRRQHWVIPPKANSAFVAAMEDVLAVYTRPRDGDCPLVCLDATSKQVIAETRVPISMKAGRPARFDYEYERNGTANLFMMFAPLEGWRHVKVTQIAIPPWITLARRCLNPMQVADLGGTNPALSL